MIFTGPLKIWNWQPEMLLMFARAKAAQLLTSDAPSGPQSSLQKQQFLLALRRWAGSFAQRNYSSRNVLSSKRPRRNGCFCRLVRKVDLNLLVLQRGNADVACWPVSSSNSPQLDVGFFSANRVNPRNLRIFEHFAVFGWGCKTPAAGVVHLLI